MTLWPESLPLPLVEYSGAHSPATLVSSLASAKIQRRSRFRSPPAKLNLQWKLNWTEWRAFEVFFLDDLDNGAAQFQIDLRCPKSSELTAWVVRFLDGYSCDHSDGIWTVTALLEMSYTPLVYAAPKLGWTFFDVVFPAEVDYVQFVDHRHTDVFVEEPGEDPARLYVAVPQVTDYIPFVGSDGYRFSVRT